ncbi:MAG TPA: citramalate synthase [bacterium]|nr:citramalate synthase [bacterium]
MTHKVTIYDTTLRDGSQGEDVSFSVNDKLRIAQKLDELGVHYIEGGWPGANPKDTQFFQEARKLPLHHAALAAFGSTRRKGLSPGQDPQVKDLLDAHTRIVTIVGKTWDFHVREVLGASLTENLAMISDTIDHLKQKGREVFFDAEHFFDAWRANRTYTEEVIMAAARAGADSICLCDTNGGSLPGQIVAALAATRELIALPLGIHCHNDSELAVANTLAAVKHGAAMVQGTINGLGERAGNANLCSIIPDLILKLGVSCIPRARLKKLREVSHFIYELALMAPPTHQPFVGDSAFAHKGGQHGDAVRKNPETYEQIEPELVGNRRRFIVSDLSGCASIEAKAEEYGCSLPRKTDEARHLLQEVKRLEEQGYQFEGAEASFELLMHAAMGKRKRYFDFKGFRVIDERKPEDVTARAEATIMLEVQGKGEAHTAAAGVGPVNALDNALRKALERFFPRLNEVRLIDYKVRVLPAGLATASKVRVLIESTDGTDTWGTVGVSDNIIEASWQALIDSIDYKLFKDEKQGRRKKGRKKL